MISFVTAFWPFFVAAGGLIIAYFKGVKDSSVKEDKRRLEAERDRAKAVVESKEFDDQAQALSDEDALKEALKWSK